ncbi:MAG: glycine zipper 2TM domain-containing protein [Bdellovibrionaceae bacterium]|nr:glycine zipper 2TM domain-containing protein [Pseudobdellovibrionaceae bacterium]
MNHKILSYGVAATMLMTSISFHAQAADKEDVGAIVGAVVGGILGNQVGGGSGKAVATGLGIIVGAVVGAEIGQSLDQADRRALEDAQRDVFRRPVGERSDWDGNRYGSRTGSRGHIRTTREGYLRSNSREVCREYEQVIVTRQKTETRTGFACSRADGSWREVNSTEVVFHRPSGPVRPDPTPTYPTYPSYPTHPSYPTSSYGSLQGYCSDYDHQQFYTAKNFAYSASGLNYLSDKASQWAINYNQSHRCGTIEEYMARYKILYNLAYSSSGLNLSPADARNFALQRADTMTVSQARQYEEVTQTVRNFVYSSSGLNRDRATAARISREWADRGYCGDSQTVRSMIATYSKEYNFAYSVSGLNYNPTNARAYAIERISRITRCADLFR